MLSLTRSKEEEGERGERERGEGRSTEPESPLGGEVRGRSGGRACCPVPIGRERQEVGVSCRGGRGRTEGGAASGKREEGVSALLVDPSLETTNEQTRTGNSHARSRTHRKHPRRGYRAVYCNLRGLPPRRCGGGMSGFRRTDSAVGGRGGTGTGRCGPGEVLTS